MAHMFMAILLTSVVGTFLVIILIFLRPVTRKHFSAGWHYYMWLAVLLVMMMPVRVGLPEFAVATTPVAETTVYTENRVESIEAPVISETQLEIIPPERSENKAFFQSIKEFIDSKAVLFSYVWLFGAILIFLIKTVSYMMFLIKMKSHSEAIPCLELMAYTKRKVKTRVSDTICSPLTVGLFKPTLILPRAEMTPKQLENVIAHEMTHLSRNDILYKWFLSIVKCVHWFNPAIYFIGKQINIDCEISCDLSVLKKMNQDEERDYIETILSLLSYNKRTVPLTTGMTGSKKTLKKRFLMIKNKVKVSRKAVVLSLIAAALILAGTITLSGVLNSRLLTTADNSLIDVDTDERQGEEFNFLTIGVDDTNRIDAILIFNFDGNALTGMIIPRNTDFAVENSGIQRLSDLLSGENGNQEVINSVKNILGIPIHYYARVKIDAVRDIVNNIGGIDFNVPYDMIYDDPYQDLHINLAMGEQKLTGDQVEQLLRYRDKRHTNGEEVRMLTWHSVIKEFLNQAVIGNKLKDIPKLYEIAVKNIETNYSLEDFLKDIKVLKNINRNNIVIENIPGKNVVLDNGYFVYQINMDEAKPLLNIFNAAEKASNLVSTIPYSNDVMGFKINLPERWKGKYEVIQFDNQIAFFHKDIFLKYGKGSGNLFRITKVKSSESGDIGEPGEYLHQTKEYVYIWSVASDVQYPIWEDRDEEDAELAEEFEDMMIDLEFVKNSFSIIEAHQTSVNLHKSSSATPVENTARVRIKSSEVSDEPYGGFEQLAIKDMTSEKLQGKLMETGATKSSTSSADLSRQYIVSDYSYEESLSYNNEGVKCDENGNISIYFAVNSDSLVNVKFSDTETSEEVGGYGILANNENAYTFVGFDPDKTYNVAIQGDTQDTWKIEGEYIIY